MIRFISRSLATLILLVAFAFGSSAFTPAVLAGCSGSAAGSSCKDSAPNSDPSSTGLVDDGALTYMNFRLLVDLTALLLP